LSGEPFGESTVGALAGQLETPPQILVEDLGQNLTTLPETARTLTSPLANGEQLGVLNGVKGLVMGLLGRGTEVIEGEGGDPGAGGSGGAGGGPGAVATAGPVAAFRPPATRP
jgi:hypothetical protein